MSLNALRSPIKLLRRVAGGLRGLFRKERDDRELDEELRSYLDAAANVKMRAGVPHDEAVRAARMEMGSLESVKEEVRAVGWETGVAAIWQDLRFGVRTVAKSPGFAAVAIITLALGIGANTAIFSVVNAVLLRPLPYPEAARIVQVWHVPPPKSFPGMTRFAVSPANYLDWRSQNHVFEGIEIYGFGAFNFTNGDRPEVVQAARVAADFFSVLRVQPMMGRIFAPEEDQSGHSDVVILAHAFWQSRFGANRDIIGQTVALNGNKYTVVGVMPPSFQFPAPPDAQWNPQIFAPLGWTDKDRAVRGNHNYLVVARLRSGVELRQAQAEMNAISSRLEQQYPEDDKGWGAVLVPLREQLVGDVRPALLVLLGAVAFVLLIACANVANLLLARTLARRKEIAIRTALGAGRGRVLQQVLSETLLLSLAGGALGLLLARFGIDLIVHFLAARLPRSSEIGLDALVLTFTLVISVFSGLVAGLVPALRLTRTDVNQALKEGLGRTSADSGGQRTRRVLVVTEVALSLVLLIGAGLMIRSLWMLRRVDPGFDPHNVLTMFIPLPQTKYVKPVQQLEFFDQLLQRVRALPGVESAGATDALPLMGGSTQPVTIEGQPIVPMSEQPEVAVRRITPGYLRTMRVPLQRGRDFNEGDTLDRPAVVLISKSMAEQFWPKEDPIGKHLTLTFFRDTRREVVGIVGDVKQDGLEVDRPIETVYGPVAKNPGPWMSLVVRTAGKPASLVSAVTGAVREVDREQPVVDVATMEEILGNSFSQRRFTMLLLAAFAGLALLLAAIGIYGVLSYAVRRRVQEIGIRVALGAQQADVLRLVVGQGLRLTLAGLAIGVVIALGLTRLLTGMLFSVKPTDPLTFVAVAALLCSIALLACYLPARRATRVDPVVALRYE